MLHKEFPNLFIQKYIDIIENSLSEFKQSTPTAEQALLKSIDYLNRESPKYYEES